MGDVNAVSRKRPLLDELRIRLLKSLSLSASGGEHPETDGRTDSDPLPAQGYDGNPRWEGCASKRLGDPSVFRGPEHLNISVLSKMLEGDSDPIRQMMVVRIPFLEVWTKLIRVLNRELSPISQR